MEKSFSNYSYHMRYHAQNTKGLPGGGRTPRDLIRNLTLILIDHESVFNDRPVPYLKKGSGDPG